MLTANVPHGNAESMEFWTNRDTRYLDIPPKKLPVPINISILNIFSAKVDKIINFVKIEIIMKKLFLLIILAITSASIFAQQTDSLYTSKEVSIKSPTGDIYGTLLTPQTSKKAPLAIIIAGSGNTDRNGNQPQMKNNSLKFLAEYLSSNGIATLRFDKRGIAKSAGTVKESDLRFEDYINDAVNWVELFKADKSFSKIFIIGHSEGSLIGMIAAERTKADGYVSVAGIASPADQILIEQLKTAVPPQLFEECKNNIDTLKQGKLITKPNPMLASLFRPSVQPYMISWFKYNPVDEIAKLKCPILILQGTTDIQVGVENAKKLALANNKSKLVVIDGMNHILKMADADRQKNMMTYINPELPVAQELLDSVKSFIIK